MNESYTYGGIVGACATVLKFGKHILGGGTGLYFARRLI
jgi:hypothetical protein